MTSDDTRRALRTACMTLARRVQLVPLGGFALLGSLAASAGCVMGNDNDPPVLSVDLYWETERYSDRTCTKANVAAMGFRLLDAQGEVIAQNASEEQYQGASRCVNGIDFPDLDLGDYSLELTGYDADHNIAWRGTCDLSLDRFDRLYSCDIQQVEPVSDDES